MSRSGEQTRRTSGLARLAALAGLLPLLVVPTLHGALAHGAHDCADSHTASASCVDAGSADLASVEPADPCLLCLVAGAARTLLPARLASEAPGSSGPEERVRLGSRPHRHGLPALALAAPRAPPVAG